MNAIDFLIKEHDKVRSMLADISDSSHREETKKKRFDELCQELIRHETMEETLWYPHIREQLQSDSTINHLIKEENHAVKAMEKIKNITEPNKWESAVEKFVEDVKKHACEEEEKLFPKVQKILTETELNEIGKKFYHFKQEYNITH